MSKDIRKWMDIINEGKIDLILGLNKNVKVIRNPNNVDLENILNKSYVKSARMTIDKNTGDVWIWNADWQAHSDVQTHLKKLFNKEMQFDARFVIVKIEYTDEDKGNWGYALGGDSYSNVSSQGTVEQAFDRWKHHRLFTRMFGNKEFGPVDEVESTYWSRIRDDDRIEDRR